MAEKLRYWWSEDRKFFCIYADDGVGKTTISLSISEAADLGAEAFAPPLASEGFRVVSVKSAAL